jgi:hypothetical protein
VCSSFFVLKKGMPFSSIVVPYKFQSYEIDFNLVAKNILSPFEINIFYT